MGSSCWKLNDLCIRLIQLVRLPLSEALSSMAVGSYILLIFQCPCKLSLGGPALRRWLHHQRRAWPPLPSLLPRLVIEKAVWQKIEHLLEKVHPFLPPWIRSCGKTSSMVRHQPKRTRAGVGVTRERPKTQCAPTGWVVQQHLCRWR